MTVATVARPGMSPTAPIPRTVPLHMVTQQLSGSPPGSGNSSPKHKISMQQAYHQSQNIITSQYNAPVKKPVAQIQECWSPPSDLSPILDVSPSIEAAEQLIMDKFKTEQTGGSIPRATSGTITGMIADFNKAIEALGSEEEELIIVKERRDSKGRRDSKDSSRRSSEGMQLQIQGSQAAGTLLPSPQVEQQLQQQQILIHQQQQFLQIQLEQQKLQKQMQEQISKQQQQAIDKEKERDKLLQQQEKDREKERMLLLEREKIKEKEKEFQFELVKPKQEQIKKIDKEVNPMTPPERPEITSITTVSTTTTTTSSSRTTEQGPRSARTTTQQGQRVVVVSKKYRRLPQPSAEEAQSAVQLAVAQQGQQQFLVAGHSQGHLQSGHPPQSTSPRPVSPLMPRKTQTSVISHQTIISSGHLTGRTRHGSGGQVSSVMPSATVLTTATSTLVSSVIVPSTVSDLRTGLSLGPSLGPLGALKGVVSGTLTPGDSLSDSQSETGSAGGKGKNRRKLPSVPLDEEPVSMLSTKKLIKEKLSGAKSLAGRRLLRPSSSLDSSEFIGAGLRQTVSLNA